MDRSCGGTMDRRGRTWGVGLAVLALAVGALSGGSSSATSSESEPARDRVSAGADDARRDVVTLVTGDLVAVSTLPGGRTIAAMLPGSPHFSEPMHTVALADKLYVRPVGLSPAEARRLDESMFNVTRLGELADSDGSVPVEVTYADGARPHDVPGVDVDSASARAAGADRTVARGSYSAGDAAGGSWRGVTDVSLPGVDASDPEPAADGYELHTLAVNVRDRQGDSTDCAKSISVLNLDDSSLFNVLDFCAVDGRTKLSVPDGNYAVISESFQSEPYQAVRVAGIQRLRVFDDTEITVSSGEATARVGFPTLPGAKPLVATFNYNRYSADGGGIDSSYTFPPGFVLRVEPAGSPKLGDLLSSVRARLRIPHERRPADIAETLDWQRGVPADLTFEHVRSDFTDVTASYYSDGRRRKNQLSHAVFAFMPKQTSDASLLWPMRSPLTRHELYLGEPKVRWTSVAIMGSFPALTEMGTRDRLYRPGDRWSETWLRGPMAPGAGFAVRMPPTGQTCPACRTGDIVRLYLAQVTDAELDHWGNNWDKNPWILRRGGDVVARGNWPQARIEVPAAKARYHLRLRHKMHRFQLSTQSQTTWSFDSATSDQVLPLLMPRYDLPVDLLNRLPAGRTSFRLAIPRLGSEDVQIVKPRVKVSYNGGKTWQAARVIRRGPDAFRVRLDNPKPGDKPRYGSLRVFAKDRAGDTVHQTIKRAWRIRGGGATAAGADAPSDGTSAVPRQACGSVGERKLRCLAIVDAYGSAALDTRADPEGYGAHELRDAYNLPAATGEGQTVAVVVAHDYPTAARDLNAYRRQFGLPSCTVASGCFTKLNQDGVEGDYPRPNQGWALEAALDLQMISAACPRCRLVLVEANSPFLGPITNAVDTAARVADVVSNSYGSYEFTGVESFAQHYDVDGVPMTASAGNSGYEPAHFPASSPAVISVGGTALRHADNDRGWRESAWRSGSSGCSAYFAKPSWQTDTACHMRTIADVAAVGDPNTGVAVYDSFGYFGEKGWFVLGGTSTAAPLVAGMIAAAGDADTFDGADLYTQAGTDVLHDIVTGSNRIFQACKGSYMCNAKSGYDAPTGIGTPNGLEAFTDVTP